jgi:hypothetical protein
MTTSGFEVTVGLNTTRFPQLDDAFAFAQQRLRDIQRIRELSNRCE